ncbi:MAG: hypothetical protein NDP13_04230 [Crenarchaeota archaeon]|nr:hypothetical protein [Thermoproteota archaeon]MCR8454180.1 hypothetical protein [Thermoproteota archaeon]MCR8455580.1 hypothetical protein [Thermoproteota archaeon]MCR8463194.1 hypothetical protein [Thermoproteota archaeon]MCR8470561.1 hypothetical protein [Thermoproteota archaeon]
MLSQDDLRDLAIFLTTFGPELKKYLQDPSRIPDTAKARVWLESAKRLGIIEISGGIMRVQRDGIRRLIEEITRSFEELLEKLSR